MNCGLEIYKHELDRNLNLENQSFKFPGDDGWIDRLRAINFIGCDKNQSPRILNLSHSSITVDTLWISFSCQYGENYLWHCPGIKTILNKLIILVTHVPLDIWIVDQWEARKNVFYLSRGKPIFFRFLSALIWENIQNVLHKSTLLWESPKSLPSILSTF